MSNENKTAKLNIKKIANTSDGQDGMFFGDYMFRFHADGRCMVFDARPLDSLPENGEPVELPMLCLFRVGEGEPLVPHFNAVCFGNEYLSDGDEFPVFYANIYNNYAKSEGRLEGTCCAYRLTRNGNDFSATLLQVIKIGFTDTELWRSAEGIADARPYGNFLVDKDSDTLYAYTMRDGDRTTRYFSFKLPSARAGEMSEEYGVPLLTLTEGDILASFDTPYHLFLQGGCCHGGLIYSSEGFNRDIPPSLRVIDPKEKKQIFAANLLDYGYECEAEMIDFRGDKCYYADSHGNMYRVDFDL